MNRRILVGALAALTLAPADAAAQEAVSILRGTLADTLAERAGDSPARRSATDPATPPVADDLAVLTEGQLDESAGRPASATAEVADGEGNEASLRLRAGYDTNYDELVQPEGSRFVELSGDVAVRTTVGDTDLFASGSGTILDLVDLDLDKRFGVELAAGGRREIGDGVFLEAAVGADVDGYDDPVVAEPAAALALQFVDPAAAVAVRASFDAEETIHTRRAENADDNVDFRRASLDTTVVIAPEAMFAPVISARVSRLDFPRPTVRAADEAASAEGGEAAEDPPIAGDDADETADGDDDEDDDGEDGVALGVPASIEEGGGGADGEAAEAAEVPIVRDATDMTVAAGLRFRPSEDLSITLSGRANRRDFDQPGAPSFTSYAPDVEIAWTLAEDATLSLSTTRIIDQPDEEGSLAEDVRSYAASLDYDPDLGFGAEATAGFSQIREVGVDVDSDESFLELTLRYKPVARAVFEASLLQSWTDDITFGDDTDSTQISGAVRATF